MKCIVKLSAILILINASSGYAMNWRPSWLRSTNSTLNMTTQQPVINQATQPRQYFWSSWFTHTPGPGYRKAEFVQTPTGKVTILTPTPYASNALEKVKQIGKVVYVKKTEKSAPDFSAKPNKYLLREEVIASGPQKIPGYGNVYTETVEKTFSNQAKPFVSTQVPLESTQLSTTRLNPGNKYFVHEGSKGTTVYQTPRPSTTKFEDLTKHYYPE